MNKKQALKMGDTTAQAEWNQKTIPSMFTSLSFVLIIVMVRSVVDSRELFFWKQIRIVEEEENQIV